MVFVFGPSAGFGFLEDKMSFKGGFISRATILFAFLASVIPFV